ncbi:hypothetical protein [Nocardioides sp. NPDC004968]|uniref:hypothetical protein n=1 Tax=Nocardioides sp. NPDC004968 TaxID=3155894 RepID=UPI0033B1EDA4
MSNVSGANAAEWTDATLRHLLTADRLGSYLRACDEDLSRALRLYEWNMSAGSAVIATTGTVEVIVRNALDRQLVSWAERKGRGDWLGTVPLDQRGRDDVAKARSRATMRGRRVEQHGRVVAELSFGFWRYLMSQRYHASLWVPSLHKAFPGATEDLRTRRREVESRLVNLMLVRNRAAHHEPIHRRDLLADLEDAVELVGWVHPEAGAWVGAISSLRQVANARPD